MIATGRAMCQVALLDQDCFETAHGEVAQHTSAGAHRLRSQGFQFPCGAYQFHPVVGSIDGFQPALIQIVPLVIRHLRLPGVICLPVAAQIIQVVPETHRQTGSISRSESGRLGNFGTDDRHIQDICLELHEQIVLHHAAVHFEAL